MKKLFFITLIIVVVGSSLLLGCTAPASPAGPATIKIGHVAAQTGMFSGFGTGGAFGIKAAVDDINAQGGIMVKEYNRKIPIELTIVNSESDPAKASALAEQLITGTGVVALVSGHTPPPMLAGPATVAQRYKTPYFHGGSPMEPTLALRQDAAEPWDYVWHGGFAIATPAEKGTYGDKPGYTIMDVAMGVLNQFAPQSNKTVGVYGSDDSDGVAWYSIFGGAVAQQSGFKVVGLDKKLGLAPMATTDFSPIIKEWMNNNVEIVWGNAPAPFTGALMKQAESLGFKPKMWYAARGGLFYSDVVSWGGSLANAVCCEGWWSPNYQDVQGIGGTTPQSLTKRWADSTGLSMNPNIGSAYASVQVIANVIERAGSLDKAAINAAFPATNMMTMNGRAQFDSNQYTREAIFFFQWQPVSTAEKWQANCVFSQHSWIPVTSQIMWPKPW